MRRSNSAFDGFFYAGDSVPVADEAIQGTMSPVAANLPPQNLDFL